MNVLEAVRAAVIGLVAVIACLAGLVVAPALAADPAVVKLLEKSGTTEQLALIGPNTEQQLRASPPDGIPPEYAAAFAAVVGKALDGDRLFSTVEDALAAATDDEEVAVLTAFYSSDLGRRVVAAEISAASLQDEIEQRLDELLAKARKDPRRLALYESIESATSSSVAAALTSESIMLSIAISISEANGVDPDDHQITDMKVRLALMHKDIVEAARQAILAGHELIYAGISTDDLVAYSNFLKSRPATRMNYVISGTLTGFFGDAVAEIGKAFAAIVHQKRT